MKPGNLVLRCLAKRDGDVWMGLCLDFSLVAQGDSFDEVKEKLDAQIHEYVFDALVGDDRPFSAALLRRRAPFRYWLQYWLAALMNGGRGSQNGHSKLRFFDDTVPLVPCTV